MPWKVFEDDKGNYCVHKLTPEGMKGAMVACHGKDKAKAMAQMRSMYASEDMMKSVLLDTDPISVFYFFKEGAMTKSEIFERAKAILGLDRAKDMVNKAEWSTAMMNDLPDSAFLFVESGGKKDGDGKTTPRSLRHFPYKSASGEIDLPHLRNAIARIPQSGISEPMKAKLQVKARRLLEQYGGKVEKTWSVMLEKAFQDDSKHLIYGVVLKPNIADSQGDIVSPEEIEKAAHGFFINSQLMDYHHLAEIPRNMALPVESWIAPVDITLETGYTISKGSWVMTTYIPNDDLWAEIQKGGILSYSIRGWGKRTPLETSEETLAE